METAPLAPEAEKLIEIQTQLLQANLKLDRRALQLQAAAEVSRATGSILDPDELIQQVVDLTRRLRADPNPAELCRQLARGS